MSTAPTEGIPGPFAIMLDPDGRHPMLVDSPFSTLADVARFEAEYLSKREHVVYSLVEITGYTPGQYLNQSETEAGR